MRRAARPVDDEVAVGVAVDVEVARGSRAPGATAGARSRRRSRRACRRRAGRPTPRRGRPRGRRSRRRSTTIPDAASSASSTVSMTSAPFVKTVRSSVHRAISRARAARSGGLADEGERAILQLPRVARRAAEERHPVERRAGSGSPGSVSRRPVATSTERAATAAAVRGAAALQGDDEAHAVAASTRSSALDDRAVEHAARRGRRRARRARACAARAARCRRG